ncbi:MAG TPA: LysR family transcriptional regulator [Clostridia bacterium]|nr:LysR family transcriptional regulator [Clostridia bacterium]
MTIQQLRYIVEISKYRSISKAAQSLFITQPSISKAIKDLENELGIIIFERINRGLQFTSDGIELLCYAKQLLEKVENIETRFSRKAPNKTFRFAISAQHYAFTVGAFIKYLNCQEHDDYKLYIREGKTSEVLDDIFTQRSDLGFISLSTAAEHFMLRMLGSKGIEFHLIKTMKPHVFLSKNHPLAQFPKISINQLAHYPRLSFEQNSDSLNFAEEVLTVNNSRNMVYVSDRATMNNLISHSLCYNIGSGCLLDGIIEDSIISIPIEGHQDIMKIGWIKLKNHPMDKKMSQYIELAEKSIDECYCGLRR